MNVDGATTFIVIPKEEWESIKTTQQEILTWFKDQRQPGGKNAPVPSNYITAIEFMDAVRIRRSKFDELMAGNKIKTVKKKRKIYVPVTEIERYFNDPSIE